MKTNSSNSTYAGKSLNIKWPSSLAARAPPNTAISSTIFRKRCQRFFIRHLNWKYFHAGSFAIKRPALAHLAIRINKKFTPHRKKNSTRVRPNKRPNYSYEIYFCIFRRIEIDSIGDGNSKRQSQQQTQGDSGHSSQEHRVSKNS